MNLNEKLIAKTNGSAFKENIILYKNYRVSILTKNLFRIEESKSNLFKDVATQVVWYRNFGKVNYKVIQKPNGILIGTEESTIYLDSNFENSYALINNKKVPLNNDSNLFGTYRTLDCCDGPEHVDLYWTKHSVRTPIQLEYGVISKNGVAIYDDSKSLLLLDNGEVCLNQDPEKDIYVFTHGHNYREAVNDLYKITGYPPLLPKYAFGNWWSRYYAYTDTQYLTLMDKFKQNNVPLTVAVIDMDWHYSDTQKMYEELKIHKENLNDLKYLSSFNIGWTGYTWNTELFKDYHKFLNELKDRGLKVTLNLHPADGIRFWEDQYKEMCKLFNINPKSKYYVPFDFTNPKFINAFFDILLHPYEKDGVSFWWIDWQQGTKSSVEGLDPLWSLNHYCYLDINRNSNSNVILSRYAGVGSHRYPIGFSGDSFATWESLSYVPYFTATASNVGYTYWSHDIGGHMYGYLDNELYVRYVQFGVFSPINRLHNADYQTVTKEPWFYKNGSGEIAMQFLRLRHKMIPWLYHLNYLTSTQGKALIEPLYYDFPKDNNAYLMTHEYLFNNNLVGVISTKTNEDYYATCKMFIPVGNWYDFFTENEYNIQGKNKVIDVYRTLDSLPFLIKEGSIIPLSLDDGNKIENPHTLELNVYTGNGILDFYEDLKYENNDLFGFTKIINKRISDNKQEISISYKGDKNVIPNDRKLRVVFKNLYNGEISLFINNKLAKINKLYCEHPTIEFDFSVKNTYKIIIDYRLESKLEKLNRQLVNVLLSSFGDNMEKLASYEKIKSSLTVADFVKNVKKSKYTQTIKNRILETVTEKNND